jgi:hypothetical protein
MCKATQTVTPRFVDSIFLLFPEKSNSRTIFKNPLFDSFQLSCATYGSIPAIGFGTVSEPRFIELCSNADNLNTDTWGLSGDVLNSLLSIGSVATMRQDGVFSDDRTHFFIGLPTETDNTFQQGQTSDTPINYDLTVIYSDSSVYRDAAKAPPLMCFLVDAVLSILVQPVGNPVVVLAANDVTSPELQK